jgi:hypothetical protein
MRHTRLRPSLFFSFRSALCATLLLALPLSPFIEVHAENSEQQTSEKQPPQTVPAPKSALSNRTVSVPNSAPHSLTKSLVTYRGTSSLVGNIDAEMLSQGVAQVSVTSDASREAAVFTVDNPARLVVDLPFQGSRAHALRKPARIESATNELLAAVRIAAHDTKVRIVFDLQGPTAPPYSIESRSKKLTIRLGTGVTGKSASSAPPSLSQPPQRTKEPSSVPTTPQPSSPAKLVTTPTNQIEALAPASTPIPTPMPTLAPPPTSIPTAIATTKALAVKTAPALSPTENTPAAPATSAPQKVTNSQALSQTEKVEIIEGPALVGILFPTHSASEAPTVRLTLNHRPRFRLGRRNEQSYRLRIEDCALATERVGLPFFPPQDFVGFTMIQASQVGSAVEVIIGADRGTRITATPDDSDILLRANR